jgi:glycosyltransferase involved in cell wall biosynthesis
MPKISVVIPTHNRAELLALAIRSALGQTFREIEIIVVDDASSDHTPKVVESFGSDKIRYVRHENCRGPAAARNSGIDQACGEYVAFLDDDDEWFPRKLELQMEVMRKSPSSVGLVYSGYVVVDSQSGKVLGERVPEKRGDLSKEMLVENHIGGTTCALIRRNCFESVGVFDERLPPFEDYDLWIRLSQQFQFDYVKEALFRYCIHSNNISSNLDARWKAMDMMLQMYGAARSMKKYLSSGYFSLGVGYCNRKEMRTGRRALRKAVQLNPWDIRHYSYLLAAGLGAENFGLIHGLKSKLVRSLRGTPSGQESR